MITVVGDRIVRTRLCPECGSSLYGEADLCPYHVVTSENWARGNRIMCEFFHRGIVPPRISPAERDDDFWAHAGEAVMP